MKPDQPISVGDHAWMRKAHPCGSLEWIVTRVGADIGLRCVGCGRRVLLSRPEFVKRAKTLVSAGTDEQGSARSEKLPIESE